MADAAGLSQAERMALELLAEGHNLQAVARKLHVGRKAAYKLSCGGAAKLERLRRREVRALFRVMRPEHGRDHGPVEDENGRPVTIRARPLTQDDYLQPERELGAMVSALTW